MTAKIPVNEPALDGRELEYATDAIRTGWISSAGKYLEAFERSWSSYCGMPHGIAVSNGTTALEVAMACLRLKPGDEVILPSFTIVSCALAVINQGGKPVLVDVDPETWCMDVEDLQEKVGPRTRAIMPVHMYGHPCDMGPILEIAKDADAVVVEDAAQAHGAEYKGRKCGGIGDLSTFSFYANKIVTTGEGGMVLARRDEHAARSRSFRNLCFVPERRFLHHELGHNYRLTNVQAAIGVAQVERIEESVARKRAMATAYTARLSKLDQLALPVEREWARSVYWMYGLVLADELGMDAAKFAELLAKEGVETRPFFLGLHESPAFHDLGLFRGERYPVTERLGARGLYLPSGLAITPEQIDASCAAVERVLQGASR